MGIFSRMKNIMRANISDNKRNDKESVDEMLYKMRTDLATIKVSANQIIQLEKKAKVVYDKNQDDISKFTLCRAKAQAAGNAEDVAVFDKKLLLLRKNEEKNKAQYENIHNKSERIKTQHDRFVNTIKEIEDRKSDVNSTISIAEAQEIINRNNLIDGNANNLDKILDEMEMDADIRLDTADSMDFFDEEDLY